MSDDTDMTNEQFDEAFVKAEPSNAQRARREAVQNLPRPEQLGKDSKEIAAEVRQIKELDTTTRVYHKEWLFQSRHKTYEEAAIRFDLKFKGRVHDEDWRIVAAPVGAAFNLELQLWNVVGEWSNRAKAEEQVAQYVGLNVEIVTRNSRREHDLREYGIRRLVGVVPSGSETAN